MKENSDHLKEVMLKIGQQIRILRKTKTNLDYKKMSKGLGLSDKTVLNIEHGSHDYKIKSLLKILSHYPEIKISQFFEDAGL